MCDFSLMHAKSRAAAQDDKLVTKDFGRGTIGFASASEATTPVDESTAVCVLPGTEIAFDELPQRRWNWEHEKEPSQKTARFRQIHKDCPNTHHDALEFADGEFILLTHICPGQTARILQLPAAPKTEAEAKEQTRLEVVG